MALPTLGLSIAWLDDDGDTSSVTVNRLGTE